MECVEGDVLRGVWDTFSEGQQLKAFMPELRAFKGDFIGSVDRTYCEDQFFTDDLDAYGPFANEELCLPMEISHPITFLFKGRLLLLCWIESWRVIMLHIGSMRKLSTDLIRKVEGCSPWQLRKFRPISPRTRGTVEHARCHLPKLSSPLPSWIWSR